MLVVVAVALVAASCTSDPTAAPPRVLRVLMTDDWASAQAFLDLVRDFEREHPGVRVAVDKTAIRHVPDTVRAEVNRGSPPDVVQYHAFALGAEGLAEPVDDLWRSRLDDRDFLPGALEDVTWGERRYGVPLDTNAMVLIYDPSAFARAGLAPPTDGMSFADFERQAEALTAADGSRRAIALPTSNWAAYGWIKANGGEVVRVGADGKEELTLDAPEVAEAVAFLARLVRKGVAFPPTGGDASADPLALFQSGATAFHASGSWTVAELGEQSPGKEYGIAPLPRGAGGAAGTAMGGSSLLIPRGSRNRELAFEFMLAMTSDRNALRFAKEEGRLPVRPALYDDPFFATPQIQPFVAQLRTAHPFKLEAFPAAKQSFAEALNKVLQAPTTSPSADAAASALEDARSALREAQLLATAPAGGDR